MLANRINIALTVLTLATFACGSTNLESVATPQKTQPSDNQNSSGNEPTSQNDSQSNIIEVPDDIPTTPDGYDFYYTFDGPPFLEPHENNCTQFFYNTKLSQSKLTQFYQQEMSRDGWNLSNKEEGNDQYFYYFEKSGRRAGVFYLYSERSTLDHIQVHINFSDWYVSDCIKNPSDIPVVGEFRGIVVNDFVYQYSDPSITGTQFHYRTTSSVQEVVEFYQSKMPENGWSLVCECYSSGYSVSGGAPSNAQYLEFRNSNRQSPSPDVLYRENVLISIWSDTWGVTEVFMAFNKQE